MSLFSLFRSLRFLKKRSGRKACRGRIRLLAMENLEERSLLSVTSAVFQPTATMFAEFSSEPIEPEPPITRVAGDASQSSTRDAGDFYWHFAEKIPLLRLDNEILVKLLPGADKEAILGALSDEQLALRSESTVSLDPRTMVLSRAAGDEGGIDI